MSIHANEFAISLRNDISSSRFILDESSFSEIRSGAIAHNFLGFFVTIKDLSCHKLPFFNKIELISLITNSDNIFSCLEGFLNKGI
jgi:hypothetical protein